jgi:hypothetical protein
VFNQIDSVDLSRDVLEKGASALAVVPLAHAGWTDLGRPARVLELLARAPRSRPPLRLVAS